MPQPAPANPYFRLVVVVGGVFAVTVMSLLAAAFGHPQAPVNRFFNRYGIALVLVETVVFVAVAVKALAVDRRQTLALQRSAAEPSHTDLADVPSDVADSHA